EAAKIHASADTADVRQPLAQMRLPHSFLCCLGCKKHDLFMFVKYEPLDQHESDKRFSKTDAVTQKRSTVLACDFHDRTVGFLLVTIELSKHSRAGFIPFGSRQLMPAKKLLKRLSVHVEG